MTEKEFRAEFSTAQQTFSGAFTATETTDAEIPINADVDAEITEEREITADFSSKSQGIASAYNDGGEIPVDINETQQMTASFGQVFQSGGGATSYNQLTDKPEINGVQVVGNKTGAAFGLQDLMEPITAAEIDEIVTGG